MPHQKVAKTNSNTRQKVVTQDLANRCNYVPITGIIHRSWRIIAQRRQAVSIPSRTLRSAWIGQNGFFCQTRNFRLGVYRQK